MALQSLHIGQGELAPGASSASLTLAPSMMSVRACTTAGATARTFPPDVMAVFHAVWDLIHAGLRRWANDEPLLAVRLHAPKHPANV